MSNWGRAFIGLLAVLTVTAGVLVVLGVGSIQ